MSILHSEEIGKLLIENEEDLLKTIELSGYDKSLLEDNEAEFYIRAFVLFTHFSGRVRLKRELSDIDSLYNQYYWLMQICHFDERKTGSDKGIRQHLFQLIEEMDRTTSEVDWKLIEQIDKGEL